MGKQKNEVRFYADSYRYGKNYLFIFRVNDRLEAAKLARKFRARAAYFGRKGESKKIRIL